LNRLVDLLLHAIAAALLFGPILWLFYWLSLQH
jgi:hypothetical protein